MTKRLLSLLLVLLAGVSPAFAQNPVTLVGTPTVDFVGALYGTAGSGSTRVLTIQGAAGGTAVPISAASLPLPTGAATSAGVTALQVAQGSTTSGQSGTLMQGAVTTAAPTYTTAQTSALSLDTAGNLRVSVSGGGSNAAASATGSAVPASAGYTGVNVAGTLRGATGLSTGSLFPLTVAIVDASGAQVTSFGGSGGTASNFGSAFPTPGTAVGFLNSAGTNMAAGNLDASGFLKVNVAAGGGSGGTSSTVGSATPSTATAVGYSDGTNLQVPRLVDADTGAGTVFTAMTNLVRRASGGPTEMIGSTTSALSLPVVIASDQGVIPVQGGKTNNNAAPGATNTGALGAIANAAAPTYTEGNLVLQSTDLHGSTRATLLDASGTALTAATLPTHDGALTIASTTAGLQMGRASAAAPTGVSADDDAVLAWYLRNGSQVVNLAAGGNLIGATSNALDVNIKSGGGSGGTAIVDEAAFTQGTTSITPIGGLFKTAYSALTSGQAGIAQMTSNGGLYTNLDKVQGTNVDVNSGAKSAGTIRVVLATDQPQLTAKLLVTPDSVALPANQSTNESQINGVTPLMGNGVTGTGSQRVTIASDNTAFSVNVAAALPAGANTIGALTANQSTNESQINGVTPLMGNGVTGTGSQRVTIASDNTAFSVNAVESGTWTVQPGNTPNTTAWIVQTVPGTTNGLTPFFLEPTASDNHTVIKNGAGTLYHVVAFNNSATINYLRFYNAGTGFNGCNSATNLLWSMQIPASTSAAGFVEDIAQGVAFSTGISICVTGAFGQTSTTSATATAIALNIGYK